MCRSPRTSPTRLSCRSRLWSAPVLLTTTTTGTATTPKTFVRVLSGTLVVYTEFYEPVTLHAGDSIYYDGRMGHACVSEGETDAVALWVSST